MDIQFKPVPCGDMAGSLAHFVETKSGFNVEKAINHINARRTGQPPLILLYDDGANTEDIATFCATARIMPATIALVTRTPLVFPSWYAVNRVVLITTPRRYTGIPANEVHLAWAPEDERYPVVAPLGAQQTHVYATASKPHMDALIEWARKAPYPIGVISQLL